MIPHRFPILISALLAAAISPAPALDIRQSETDPRDLAYFSDPDKLYFAPGNDGQALFSDTPTSHPGNLQPWQDQYCDSTWLAIDSPSYDVRLISDAATSRTDYWQRNQSYLWNASMSGIAPAWVINDNLAATLQATPAFIDEITSNARAFSDAELNSPAIVFDLTNWDAPAHHLVRHLSEALPHHAIAAHVHTTNIHTLPHRNWTFLICDEEILPETWSGQAAPAWLHHKFGQVPVIMSPVQPDFQRDTIWLSCGAAGIWYRPLAIPGTIENSHAAIHLRATTTFLNRFQAPVALAPRPLHPAANFSLIAPGESIACVIPSSAGQITLTLPPWLQNQTLSRVWFNPATDENIMQPLTQVSDAISFHQPDDNLWVYSLTRTTVAADTGSTVSAIKTLSF